MCFFHALIIKYMNITCAGRACLQTNSFILQDIGLMLRNSTREDIATRIQIKNWIYKLLPMLNWSVVVVSRRGQSSSSWPVVQNAQNVAHENQFMASWCADEWKVIACSEQILCRGQLLLHIVFWNACSSTIWRETESNHCVRNWKLIKCIND